MAGFNYHGTSGQQITMTRAELTNALIAQVDVDIVRLLDPDPNHAGWDNRWRIYSTFDDTVLLTRLPTLRHLELTP